MATDNRLERAKDSGLLDKLAIDDLGAIFKDFDTSLGGMDDLGNVAHTHAPTLLEKLERLQQHGFGAHVPSHHTHHLEGMLRRFRGLVERNMHLERELAWMKESSNVIVSTPLDNVPLNSTSTVVTLGTPYSGVDFMLCAMLLPAEITPAGRFATLNFAGIDFATPSTSNIVVQYTVNTPGSQGQPVTGGMGLSSFYTNLTMPSGRRVFEPWVGWIFDASAKISFSVYNPSLSFTGTYLLDWMMKASPCPQNAPAFQQDMVHGHVGFHEGVADLYDNIHAFTLGVSPRARYRHDLIPQISKSAQSDGSRALRSGYHMLATSPTSRGIQ